MVSIGIHWNSHISGEFQWIPMFAFVTIIIYKKVHEQGLNHSLSRCHMHRKQQYIHSAMQLLWGIYNLIYMILFPLHLPKQALANAEN